MQRNRIQSYVIQFATLKDENVQFINDLIQKLKPKAVIIEQNMVLDNIISDLEQFFLQEKENAQYIIN